MATKTDPKPAGVAAEKIRSEGKTYEGLSREQLIDAYRIMYTSRRVDDREILLKRQQKIFFQISGAGHEAVGVAAGFALKPGYDWFYPYYRDRALCLALGATPHEMLLMAVGAADDRQSGGRQMPSHWSFPKFNVVTQSSPTGSQILQAVGCAEGGRYFAAHPQAAKKSEGDYRQFKDVKFQRDEVTYVSLGRRRHQRRRVLGGDEYRVQSQVAGVVRDRRTTDTPFPYPSRCRLRGATSRGWSPVFRISILRKSTAPIRLRAYAAFVRTAAHCRAGEGPGFIHAHVIRPYSHSLSDDERLYRPDAERNRDAARDPITRMQMFLIREGILDEKGINKLEKQVEDDLQVAVDQALDAPPPTPDTIDAVRLLAGSGSYFFGSANRTCIACLRLRTARRSLPRPWPI